MVCVCQCGLGLGLQSVIGDHDLKRNVHLVYSKGHMGHACLFATAWLFTQLRLKEQACALPLTRDSPGIYFVGTLLRGGCSG